MDRDLKPAYLKVNLTDPAHTQAVYVDPRGRESVVAQFDHTRDDPKRDHYAALMTFLVGNATGVVRMVSEGGYAGDKLKCCAEYAITLREFEKVHRHGALICTPKVFAEKVLRGECLG